MTERFSICTIAGFTWMLDDTRDRIQRNVRLTLHDCIVRGPGSAFGDGSIKLQSYTSCQMKSLNAALF